ncbi:hypothetical protein [Thalassobellus suaedae]|uniref:Uncharacterized protein n=1 Tax=Thalassobellus suaedae TaxID=3074124 RepID=A0ABY9Y1S7_9FLAO|nr:hypothetical protein RHP49_14920 [Flavobacteriaceae bacterium HL-DH10]
MMSKFKYSLTVLNSSVITGYLFLLVYGIMKWDEVSKGDGYGIVALALVFALISSALFIDFILQLIFRKKIILNIIGTLFIPIYLYIIILNS